ncbi:MAG: hypothetical protein ACOZQL_23175 [Myxococcota bacterium]
MRLELTVVVVGLISACGTPTPGNDAGVDAGSDAGAATIDAGPLGDAGTRVGLFQLQHTVSQFGDSSNFFGKVYDGPTPKAVQFAVDLTNGDCRVEVPVVPFCATPCGGSAVCVSNDTCQPYPTSRSVGTLHAAGFLFTASGAGGGSGTGGGGGATGGGSGGGGGSPSATEFDLAVVSNGYSTPASVQLSVPPFADQSTLTLTASGSSVVSPFTLSSTGVAPIALTQSTWALASGSALDLQWTPGSTSTGARIEVEIDISHHGGLRGQIVCDTADDGALSIGADLVTRLIGLGVSGFPTIVVRRIKTGSTVIQGGRVDFEVLSSTEKGLTIPGLVSCTDTSECPMGQTCQDDLRCQ